MIGPGTGVRVYLACGVTDMRKGIEGLSMLAQDVLRQTLSYVAEMLEEDVDLLRAVIRNDDNLTYGSIISIYDGTDVSNPALTDDGVDELSDMLSSARRSKEAWHSFLEDFVDDEEVAARVKSKYPR